LRDRLRRGPPDRHDRGEGPDHRPRRQRDARGAPRRRGRREEAHRRDQGPRAGAVPVNPTGRLLGIDCGTVRVGLAISDPDRIIASPYDTLTRGGDVADAAYFTRLVTAEKVVGLVVGLPLHTRGHESVQSAEARRYGAWLASVTGLPVVFWDERYTS